MIEVLLAGGQALAVVGAFSLCLYGLWAVLSDQPLYLTHESPPPEGDGLSHRRAPDARDLPGRRGGESPQQATADTGDTLAPDLPAARSDHADTEPPPPTSHPPDAAEPSAPPET